MPRHNNAIIWLQDGEEEGTADCGCRLINDDEGARFIMCGTHEAAPELLEALRAAWHFIENVTSEDPDRNEKFFTLREIVRDTIRKVGD
jgi:hypothetical protein